MSEIKFCKDCKHYDCEECYRNEPTINLVTGNTYKRLLDCNSERYAIDDLDDYCGFEGKYWEAK